MSVIGRITCLLIPRNLTGSLIDAFLYKLIELAVSREMLQSTIDEFQRPLIAASASMIFVSEGNFVRADSPAAR